VVMYSGFNTGYKSLEPLQTLVRPMLCYVKPIHQHGLRSAVILMQA